MTLSSTTNVRGHVLLTNDDGINAPGLQSLHQVMQEMGYKTLIVAPDTNQTAKSQSLSIDQHLKLKKISTNAYSLSGTPVDCVRVGTQLELFSENEISLVISGINNGLNGGEDFLFSGTLGAATHAARLGIPAVAVSQGSGVNDTDFRSVGTPDSFAPTSDVLCEFMSKNDVEKLPENMFLSINVPFNLVQRTPRLSPLGSRFWNVGKPDVAYDWGHEWEINPWSSEPRHSNTHDFELLDQGIPTVSAIHVAAGGACFTDRFDTMSIIKR